MLLVIFLHAWALQISTLFEMHNHHVSYRVAYPMPPNTVHASNRWSVNVYLRGRGDCASLKLGVG